MKRITETAVIAVLFGTLAACGSSEAEPAQENAAQAASDPHSAGAHDQHHALPALPGGASLEGDFIGVDGTGNGTVMIAETPNGLLVRVDVTGISHGFHGVHLHAAGLCEPGEGFKTAGGHANPDGVPHGFLTEGGPHLGDLPNSYAHQEGHLRTDLFKAGASLADLQDADGFAVMVHSGPDDYASQPSGAAGSRVACAAFPG